MSISEEYKKINRFDNSVVIKPYPKSHVPEPTENDYFINYIYRYFVKINDIIYEIDIKQYDKYNSDRLKGKGSFNLLKIKWFIYGNKFNVIDKNTKILNFFEQKMDGISIRLGNRLQFWKE